MLDNAHALLFGIAAYQHINPLPATVIEDVRGIYDLLVDPALGAYDPQNVRLLTDGQATRTAMLAQLADLAARSDDDSIVFIYISSHGGRIESGPAAGAYLLPVDARLDDAAGVIQIAPESAISGDDWTAALNAIPARRALVIFDCCHAGGIGRPKDALSPAYKVGLPESYYEALSAGRGRAILASSRSSEYSYIMPGDSNSLFTKHLLAGLGGDIPSADGLITLFDLFEYVQPLVTVENPEQHPIFKAEIEQNFPVALRLGGQKSAAPPAGDPYAYDVYISYAEDEPKDANWVWEILWPRLEAAGLRVAISDDVAEPGVSRVVNIERGIKKAKRTLLVLSPYFLDNRMAQFESVMAQTMSVEEGAARMLTVILDPIESGRLPYRLSPNIVHPADLSVSGARAERRFDRLVSALQEPPASLF